MDFKIPNLTVHCMVKNEEKYCYQAITSVAPYVERMIVIDTGSTDKTWELINKAQSFFPNIELYSCAVSGDSTKWDGLHLSQQLTDVRNKMIDMTVTPWIMQLDGDEIYSKNSMLTLANAVRYISAPDNSWCKGLMVKIKWCVAETEYVEPGPYPKTLRIYPKDSRHVGTFPNEFVYVDGQPIFINDIRCQTIKAEFLHMSMVLHPERRPINGRIYQLTNEEQNLIKGIINV